MEKSVVKMLSSGHNIPGITAAVVTWTRPLQEWALQHSIMEEEGTERHHHFLRDIGS